MAKRKGCSTSSRPWTRSKAAEERSKAKTSETGVSEGEWGQLRCEVRELEGVRAELSDKQWKVEEHRRELEEQKRELGEQKRYLEEQERKLGEQLPPLRCELEQVQRKWLPKSKRLKGLCNEREVENTQRLLGMLPREVWEKILDNLNGNDLFPLALSCRYFRQKQKEVVERSMRQSGRESGATRLTLKTDLQRKYWDDQPASADYLRFCSKEKVSKVDGQKRDKRIMELAAYHGHLPLLQELLDPANVIDKQITEAAGESSSFSSSLFRLLTSFSLSPLHSAWRPTGDRAVAENLEGVQAGWGCLCLGVQEWQFEGREVAQEEGRLPLECKCMHKCSNVWSPGGIEVAQERDLPLE